jgi:hypothetical protein
MRICQLPLDEGPLWEHLQSGEFEEAKEIVNYYYSRSNPNGFDDPEGITKASQLTPIDQRVDSLRLPLVIRKGSSSPLAMLYGIVGVFCFFGFLSFYFESVTVMWVPCFIAAPFSIPAFIQLLDKRPQISLTEEHVEFRKSKKEPIKWDNILTIYHYFRSSGGYGGGPSYFIEIYRKNAVKSESFYLNYLEYKPNDIVYLINKFKK